MVEPSNPTAFALSLPRVAAAAWSSVRVCGRMTTSMSGQFKACNQAMGTRELLAEAWAARAGCREAGSCNMRAVYPAAGLLVTALAIGLAGRTLLVRGAADPDLPAMMPLLALTMLVLVVSVAGLWPRLPRWGKALAAVLWLGWLQAAVRG